MLQCNILVTESEIENKQKCLYEFFSMAQNVFVWVWFDEQRVCNINNKIYISIFWMSYYKFSLPVIFAHLTTEHIATQGPQ